MRGIENHIRKVYDEIRAEIPGVHHFSMAVGTYRTGDTDTYGFWYIGDEAMPFRSIEELIAVMDKRKEHRAKNEILFRKF